MNIKSYILKICFAIILACIYLTFSLLSSQFINKIMNYYKNTIKNHTNDTNDTNIQIAIRVYLRTALIIIFLYLIRSSIKYLLPANMYDFDLNNSKQIERNAIICSYGLFLLQPEYNKDIKKLLNNLY